MKPKIYTAQIFKNGELVCYGVAYGSEKFATERFVNAHRPCTMQIYAGNRTRSFPRQKWIKEVNC